MAALDGIRVIEIASWAAVPSTGALLAEQDAEVIKIEPPQGDPMRGLMHQASRSSQDAEPIDHAFQFSNRRKKSVALALNTDEGRKVALDLIASADIVITNLLPHKRARLGFTVAEIRGVNPEVIIGVLTGYGERGPDANVPGYDLTAFFARSGLSASIAGLDGRPPRWRAAQGDNVAGLALYAGIMTALVTRERTGVGSVVETSLLSSAAWSNAFDLTRAAADGRPARAKDRYGSVNPTVEAYLCSDGRYVQLTMAEPITGWRILCDVLDRPDLLDDERFADPAQRVLNMPELIALLDQEFSTRVSHDIVDAILARGAVAAVVLQSHEVVADPQVRESGVFRAVERGNESFEVVSPPFSLGDQHVAASFFEAPGADTDAVLRDVLGLDEGSIVDLETAGAVARTGPTT